MLKRLLKQWSQELQPSQIVVTPPTSPPPPNSSPKMSRFAATKTTGKCPQVSSKVYSFCGTHRAGVCHEVSEKISNSSMLKYHLQLWSDTWQLSCQTTLKNVSTSYQKYMVFQHGWISCKKYPVISHLQKLKHSVERWSLFGSLLTVQPLESHPPPFVKNIHFCCHQHDGKMSWHCSKNIFMHTGVEIQSQTMVSGFAGVSTSCVTNSIHYTYRDLVKDNRFHSVTSHSK